LSFRVGRKPGEEPDLLSRPVTGRAEQLSSLREPCTVLVDLAFVRLLGPSSAIANNEITSPASTANTSVIENTPIQIEFKKTHCHPEATALSSPKDPSEPREATRFLRRVNRANGSHPYLHAAPRAPKTQKPLHNHPGRKGPLKADCAYLTIISPSNSRSQQNSPSKKQTSPKTEPPFVIPNGAEGPVRNLLSETVSHKYGNMGT
jgi:hypothetical protein